MNKKQKILAILCVGLVLFLITSPVLGQNTNQITETNSTEQSLEEKHGKLAEILSGAYVGSAPPGGIFAQSTEELTMAYVAAWLGAQLVRVAAFLLNFVLDLSFDILNNHFVTIGWTISRDLTNLGFVLFIIIIAIATILRYQEYAAKSTLAKLIAVALLVNFSLMFSGIFVDFSNMLTNFFIINTAGTSYARSTNLADTIAGVFNPGRFLNIEKTEQGWWDKIRGFLNAIADPIGSLKAIFVWLTGLIFAFVFSLILGFVMLAIAVMFFVRYVALSVLLVLVPLACLFWVIPATKNLWEKWWHHFMRWVLFAPAASFFLFLAITMMDRYKSQIESASQNAEVVSSKIEIAGESTDMVSSAGTLFQNTPTESAASQIATGIMLIGFVLGGLIVANKLGIEGSKAFYGAAKGGLKGFGAWAGRKGVRTAGWAAHPSNRMLDWATNPKAGKTKQFVGRTMYKIQSGLSKVPVVKGLGKAYRKKGEHKNLYNSVVGGMKSGSGLFKKKKQQYTVSGYKEGKPILEETEEKSEKEKEEPKEKT